MEITIIILLGILLVGLAVFFIWDRARAGDRWKKQSETLAKTVGEQIAGTTQVFGEVKKDLGELAAQTKQIQEVGKNISSLQDLLRAPKFRGGFGELLLERLLADMLPRDNYSLQYEFRSGEVVDAVIRIGGNLVPIDSKFPLEAFQRIMAVESEKEQAALRKQFANAIKKHIDAVTKYILPDENTFDFALMYIPAENVYYETILRGQAEGSELYSYSLQKRVIPVSPNSFYAYLQIIILGLKGLHIEKTARDILGHLGRLQNDLQDFQGDYDTLGGHIRHATQKYDEAATKLTRLGDKLQIVGETPIEKLPEGDAETEEES
ncbi:MAG: DNA recombination protein RmuC [Chloroflexi bacterium]|nr:DNA recombination protein RmuC [Chloroflexota bacterium]